jgi:hypothetical protein
MENFQKKKKRKIGPPVNSSQRVRARKENGK